MTTYTIFEPKIIPDQAIHLLYLKW